MQDRKPFPWFLSLLVSWAIIAAIAYRILAPHFDELLAALQGGARLLP